MNMEVRAKCVGLRAGQHSALFGTGLLLGIIISWPQESAVRAAEYTSDAVTQVCVLIGPAPVFHPLRGWCEMPQPNAPRGFVKLPLACNAGTRAPRIWLCYKRGPVDEVPLVAVQVANKGALESTGFETIPAPLKQSGAGLPVHLYYKRASEPGEPVVTDLLLRTKLDRVLG